MNINVHDSSNFLMLVIATRNWDGDHDILVMTHKGRIGWVREHIVSEIIP